MQQINNQLALAQAQQKCHMPMSSESKHEEPLNKSTVEMVLGLFTRMAELFRNKARSEGIVIYKNEAEGIFSDTFKLWCVKLKDLTIENFRTGTIAMERRAEDCFSRNVEMWPPSFAEFRALAFPKIDRDSQAHKPVPSLYDPQTGTYRLEDQTAKAKRYELGKQESSKLLAMLDQPSPEKIESETVVSYGKQQLEKAKQIISQNT